VHVDLYFPGLFITSENYDEVVAAIRAMLLSSTTSAPERSRRSSGGLIATDTDLVNMTLGTSSVTLAVKEDVKASILAAIAGGSLCFELGSITYCASGTSSTSTTATATTAAQTTTTQNRVIGSNGASSNAFGVQSQSTSILIACVLAAVGVAIAVVVVVKAARNRDNANNMDGGYSDDDAVAAPNLMTSPDTNKISDADGWGDSPHSGLKWDYTSTGGDANTAKTPPRDGAPDSPGFEPPAVIRSLEFGEGVSYELASPVGSPAETVESEV
jgi:hypothetical protein